MIKKSALSPRLAEVGKIKIGGKGEKRKSKSGGDYQMPVRFGHFVVTTTERDKTGNFIQNKDLMEKLDKNPRELRIRLFFDSIDLNLQTEFAMYAGRKKACWGDGETANRLVKSGKELSSESNTIECKGTDCEFFKEKKCKVTGRLFCGLPDSMEIGGVYVFRTHSINSVMTMMGALEFFRSNTNGILQGLPFKLKMIKKATEEYGDVDYVTIVLDGLEMMEMRTAAVKEANIRKEMGVNISLIEQNAVEGGLLIDHNDPEDVEEEFYGTKEVEEKGVGEEDLLKKVEKINNEPEGF